MFSLSVCPFTYPNRSFNCRSNSFFDKVSLNEIFKAAVCNQSSTFAKFYFTDMSRQMANLHTLGPTVVAQTMVGPGTPSLGCLRRLTASKVCYKYVKVINILYICYCESRSFLRIYIMNVSDSLEFPGSIQKLREYIQWNLGNSNANFSKLPDFFKTTDGPDFFHYNFFAKILPIFRISIFRKNQFFEQVRRSQSKKFILKSPAKFEIPNCQSRSRMMIMISLCGEFDCNTPE